MNFNKVIIAGNLTDDPEKRVTDSGTTIANFSVATNRFFTDNSGEKQQRTEYHDVVFFGDTAENIIRYLEKGSQVLVEGRLQTRSWEDQDGNNRYNTEIVGRNIQFGKRDNQQSTNKQQSSEKKEEDIPVIEEDEDIDVEDIPF